MSLFKTDLEAAEKTEAKEPSNYKVVFFNDDYTTMEFVVDALMRVFGKTQDEAMVLMYQVHKEGQAIVGLYCYDIAMTKVLIVREKAQKAGFPLKVICEKV